MDKSSELDLPNILAGDLGGLPPVRDDLLFGLGGFLLIGLGGFLLLELLADEAGDAPALFLELMTLPLLEDV